MQYSQEHLKTMVYAEFGGQTECIMGNWKIENYCCFLYLFLLLQWPILQLQIETRLNANFSLDLLVGILVKFVEFKPVGFKACLRRFGKQQFICFPKVHDAF